MRLRALAFAALALGGVVAGAHALGRQGTAFFERRSEARIAEALAAAGADWVEIGADGLEVRLYGQAPDEAARFQSLEIARQVVDPRRVVDRLGVRAANPTAAPDFALEILRNEGDVSLIGLVPRSDGRQAIRKGLAAAGLDQTVTDMLETASFAPPEAWGASLRFGLEVLADLPRAKISVTPGEVAVIAVSESTEAKTALEARLEARKPPGVTLGLDISAPREVIAPFATVFVLENGAARIESCSAESEAGAGLILAAARAAGLDQTAECRIGLGAPTPDWGASVAAGIRAVAELGGGRIAFENIDAVLTGPEGIGSAELLSVAERLRSALPAVFALQTRLPEPFEPGPDGTPVYAPSFRAALLADGSLALSGRLFDASSQAAVEGLAQSLFGHAKVTNATVLDPDLPEGWPVRVLAGLEALALLAAGELEVHPDRISLTGSAMAAGAGAEAEALLAQKAGGETVVEVAFDREAAAAAAARARPLGEVCAERIEALLAQGSIGFAPGSSEIAAGSRDLLATVAAVLSECPGTRFEVGGHTDSQGSPEINQQISEQRAAAVVAALGDYDLPLVLLTARGYGPDQPIADNDTEEGRARNRRIEFRLMGEDGAPAEDAAPQGPTDAAGGDALDGARPQEAVPAEVADGPG